AVRRLRRRTPRTVADVTAGVGRGHRAVDVSRRRDEERGVTGDCLDHDARRTGGRALRWRGVERRYGNGAAGRLTATRRRGTGTRVGGATAGEREQQRAGKHGERTRT